MDWQPTCPEPRERLLDVDDYSGLCERRDIPHARRVYVVLPSNDETIDGIDRTGAIESHEHEVAF